MTIGLVGRKCGMSRIFTEDGRSVPVTLIEATPNRVTQVKTVEIDGYDAIQVTSGSKRAALISARLSAIQACTVSRVPSGLPGEISRVAARVHTNSKARSQMPIQRIAW